MRVKSTRERRAFMGEKINGFGDPHPPSSLAYFLESLFGEVIRV
jgi:hypothetical protein